MQSLINTHNGEAIRKCRGVPDPRVSALSGLPRQPLVPILFGAQRRAFRRLAYDPNVVELPLWEALLRPARQLRNAESTHDRKEISAIGDYHSNTAICEILQSSQHRFDRYVSLASVCDLFAVDRRTDFRYLNHFDTFAR